MKKLVSLLLVALLVLGLCGTALAYSPEDPITIEFWHNRGSGAQQTTVEGQINAFNETIGKEKGIIVEGVYQGGYADVMGKLQLASASGEQPVVTIVGNTRITIYMGDDLLENMLPYAQASGVDIDNFYYGMINVPYNDETQICSFPYIKSTPVFYYNKTVADQLGIEVPFHPTIADVEEICSKVWKETGMWGLESVNDFTYYQGAFLWQLGEELWNEEGKSPALAGSSMLKVLSDWRRWVDEGWCRPFDSTDASNQMQQMFYQGKIFAFWASCASMKNIEKYTTEAGYELGISCLPTYDPEKPIVPIGGGNIGLVKAGNTEEQLQAGWEFINFLLTDDMIVYNSINSGYLPTTVSAGSNAEMEAYWAENPLYKVAYDQLPNGIEQAWPDFEYNSELKTDIQSVVSLLIQEQSIDAEEAVKQIIDNNAWMDLL